MKLQWSIWSKVILIAILAATLVGFWYFENSLLFKISVVILAASGLLVACLKKIDRPPLKSPHEFIILLALYLGIFTLYNLLYGLSIPLYLVMIAILGLVSGLFFGLLILDRLDTIINPPLFWVFIILVGLVILEIFLSLSFWPIDPKVKSLMIVVIFYLLMNLIYLFSHNMLKLKRILGIMIVSILILSLMILSIWMSLRGGV